MKSANPYLNFPGNTEEAFGFYRSVFGGDFLGVTRYRDFAGNGMGVPEDQLDKIANIALPLGDSVLMATDTLDGWQPLTVGNNYYITVETDSAEEADTVFQRLCGGGRTEMPLQKTEWAEQYGICIDRFGVQWMVMYTGAVEFKPDQGSA